MSNSSSPAPESGTPSLFGPLSSTTHGLRSSSPATHSSSLFGSSFSFSNCAYTIPFSGGAPSLGFGGGSSPAPSCGWGSPLKAPSTDPSPSPFQKPNPSTSGAGAVKFQFPPAKDEPSWGSPVTTADFDGITISAEKAAILGNIKRKHPSCLSSLRLRSGSHRRSAYNHLVQVIQQLKAVVICGKSGGGADLYDKVLIWLDDLEVYGFDMVWLREEVVKLREKRMVVIAEKEAKKKAREELVKQIAAIDDELAAKEDAANESPEFLSDLFRA